MLARKSRSYRFVLAALLAMMLGCQPARVAQPQGSSCSIDGVSLDVSGREDGLYGVRDGQLEGAPIARLATMQLAGTGVNAEDGKRWLGLQLSEDDARRIEDFTRFPERLGIAVVAGGKLVSHHKVRQALTSPRVQVSCCDARACERVVGLFYAGVAGSAQRSASGSPGT
jgi:hypothetical protein